MKNSILFLALMATIFFQSCSKDSKTDETKPDVVAPTVTFSIAGFSNNTSAEPIVVSNQIEVNIDAKDAGGIAKIEAFIDDEKVGEDSSAPYSILIDVSSLNSKSGKTSSFKNYTLKITATDISGNSESIEQIINVDNEKPTITAVTLSDGTILQGETNVVTFEVMDNEELISMRAYLNDELVSDIPLDNLSVNINSNNLSDGQNTLKLEAKDSGANTGFFVVNFISDNTGPEITLDSLVANQILDASVSLKPSISDPYSTAVSAEILLDGTSLQSFQNLENINLDFDPENYNVGEHELQVTAEDDLGNTSSIEIPFNIYRRMITINIPEDRLNPAITLAVVFLSNMDGSLITSKEILREDRQIILSVGEEFGLETEFMLSFFLKDNGGSAKLSTHQNLTRNNLETLNLAVSNRRVENGLGPQIPITNFFSGDNLIVSSGDTQHSNWWLGSSASYNGYLNTSENFLYVGHAVSETNQSPFDSFYLYESYSNSSSYKYQFLDNPIPNGYILDKNDLISTGVETKTLALASNISTTSEYTNLQIFGALTDDDTANLRYHLIGNSAVSLNAGASLSYELNTIFPYFRHSLLFGKYYTERNGPPKENYTTPDLSLSYIQTNNVINLDIQGSEHVLGRMQFIDYENPNYDWYVTFNSQTTSEVVLPEIPQNITHSLVNIQNTGNVKLESVELLSYESIVDYNDYLEKVTKNQVNIYEATDWYQLVFASRTGNFNRPHLEFVFF